MHRFTQLVLAVGAVCLLAAPMQAQQERPQRGGQRGFMGGGMSSAMLLAQKPVQEDLKLTAEQVKKVEELSQKQRESFGAFQDLGQEERAKKMQEFRTQSDKAVADILQPDQAKRLKQISLQVQGTRALASPEVAKEVGVTEEQQQKIRTIQEETGQQTRQLRQPGGNPEEGRKKIAELTKSANDKILALLTADQKTKWKEMTGEPFKGEIAFGFGAGRRPDR